MKISSNSERIILELKASLNDAEFKILNSYLDKILRYSSDEKEQIYLLGRGFKEKFSIYTLPENSRKRLLREISNAGLDEYFNMKRRPKPKGGDWLILVMLLAGIVVLSAGIYQMNQGSFWVGRATRYDALVVREGGYKMLFGMMLIAGSIFRRQYVRRQDKMISI